MAITYTSPELGTLVIPGAYTATVVQPTNSGLATTGVLFLVGEADAGPAWSQEENLVDSWFGPDALAAVIAKYKSGRIVDAFRAAVAPSNDPNIVGAPTRIYCIKTNESDKAAGNLVRSGLSNWSSLDDKSWGQLGNLINASVSAAVNEVAPSTGLFTYIPTNSTSTLSVRVNGGAVQNLSIGTRVAPSALVGTVESTANQSFNSLTSGGLNMLSATGGENRGVISSAMIVAGDKLAVDATGNSIVVSVLDSLDQPSEWVEQPEVGDTLIIPANTQFGAAANSVIKGATDANYGYYVVTASSASTVTATKLRNNSGTSVTAPEDVAAVAIDEVTDLLIYSSIEVKNMTGTARPVLTGLVGVNVTGTASGSTLTLTLATGSEWNCLPQAGDRVLIPATAPAAWRAANANGGWYQVVSATSGVGAGASTIVMTRLSNGNPASFVATAIAAVTDLRVFRPAIDGVGKSMELYDGGGAEPVGTPGQFFDLSSSQVDWLSTAVTPVLLTSASEYLASLNVSRSFDNISESLVGSSGVVLSVGYNGGGSSLSITGSLTVSGTTLTTSVSGGNGANLSVDLTQFNTVGDLVTFLNAQTGYSASSPTTLLSQQQLCYTDVEGDKQTVLDKVTLNIASNLGSKPGRIKREAWALFDSVYNNSVLVQLNDPIAAPVAGQPEVQSLFFLSGGAKGSTSNADVVAAIDALAALRGNFLVTLFSRDASEDAAANQTDAASTYTIDAINAAAKSHVIAMSAPKVRKRRQAFLSYRGSFTEAKEAANNIASARCSMAFQDFKELNSQGNVEQFQPWMGATLAAGMQAAGFYKSITNKLINTSGVLMADGSYQDSIQSQVEDALLNGLLPAERPETGGFRWVEDQTTYATDGNFVYNNISAIYIADIIASTLETRMGNAFVGQSVSDASAGVILAFLQAIMKDLKNLKLITSSDGAPGGYRNAVVQISGNVAKVSVEVYINSQILFIPITAYISPVSQSAGA